MLSKYDRYSKDELIKIIKERDRKPRLEPDESPIPYQVDLSSIDMPDHAGMREHIERSAGSFTGGRKSKRGCFKLLRVL